MISKILEIETGIKNEKLRQSIKTNILNCFVCIKNYITLSPGVISPGKVENKVKEIREYVKVWIKNTDLTKKIESVLGEFENRYIELIQEEDKIIEEKQELINEVIGPVEIERPIALPNYTRKLLSEVDPIKGDVSYLPIGPCSHYCIVYKVVGDISYVIPLTTTLGIFAGYEISKSRFFKGMAEHALYQFPTSLVKEKLTMPYDHKGELRCIFKYVEDGFRSIFPKVKGKKKPSKSL